MQRRKLMQMCLLIIGLVCLAGCGSAGANSAEAIRTVVEVETIYPYIYINEIEVGGLTREEALAKLDAELNLPLQEKQLVFDYEGREWRVAYKDMNAGYAIDLAVDEAHQVARDGDLEERYDLIMGLEKNHYQIDAAFTYDEEYLMSFLEKVAGEINVDPQDATITRNGDKFTVSASQDGLIMNLEETHKNAVSFIDTKQEGQVTISVETAKPKYDQAELSQIKDMMGTYTTKSSTSSGGRYQNLQLGADRIDGTLLLPGEVFSTNLKLGPRTIANGYKNAPVIENGEMVEGLGGGVCQISSTLYNAVLFSELEVVERQNHSIPVSYMPVGRDATIAGDYIDFKFKNSTPYPIYVAYELNGTSLTATIYGKDDRDPARTLSFETSAQYISPPAEIVKEDKSLPAGERVVDKKARTGSNVQLYKKVIVNGTVVETVKIADSSYRTKAAEVRVGTGPAATPETAEGVSQETTQVLAVPDSDPEETTQTTTAAMPVTETTTETVTNPPVTEAEPPVTTEPQASPPDELPVVPEEE